MKKTFHLFIMAMLLIGSGNVLHAQPTQVSALDGRATPKNALSRQYTDEECIYYFDDGTDHYFVLQNVGDPDNAIIASFPRFWKYMILKSTKTLSISAANSQMEETPME